MMLIVVVDTLPHSPAPSCFALALAVALVRMKSTRKAIDLAVEVETEGLLQLQYEFAFAFAGSASASVRLIPVTRKIASVSIESKPLTLGWSLCRCLCHFKDGSPLIHFVKHGSIYLLTSSLKRIVHLFPQEVTSISRNFIEFLTGICIRKRKARINNGKVIYTIRFTLDTI
jgi:hypothetical protein